MFKKLRVICSEHKYFCLLVGVVLMVLLAVSVYWCGVNLSRRISNLPDKDVDERDVIHIGGSDSVFPLFKILMQEFERHHPDKKFIFLPPGHSRVGIMGVAGKEIDIGLISRNPTAKEKKQEFFQIPFAVDGLVFAVHPDTQIKNLSTRQILDIYSGKITNWREVGGEDAPIVVMDRPEYTSAKIALRKTLFPPGFEITPRTIVVENPQYMDKSLKLMPNSIGYTSLGILLQNNSKLTVISINNVFPTLANVRRDIYPYHRTFSLVIGSDAGKTIMHLFSFIFGEQGTDVIKKSSYLPVSMNLVIGTVPEQGVLKQEDRYRSLVDYLEQNLGNRVKVRLRHLPSYGDVVNEFVKGDVSAAFFGSLTYGIVKAKLEAVVVCRPEKAGVSRYCGLILARADSGIRNWRDLEGRSFSMIRTTTAADLFPRLLLKREGVERPEDFFGRIKYAGSHDASVEMVLNKTVDAGAAKDIVFEKLARQNPRLKKELIVIARSKSVPDNALVIRRDLKIACYGCHFDLIDQETSDIRAEDSLCGYLKQKLEDVLTNMDKTPEGREVLREVEADRFLPTSDEDYKNLYEMARELEIDLAQYPLD